jgi:GTP-binding protein
MLPVVAIVGRPNVGKSTFFNRLTKTRAALVCDMPGMTRDRQYGEAIFQNKRFIVIDTGGIEEVSNDEKIESLAIKQSWLAVQEAEVVLFLVDARKGLASDDDKITKELRKLNKKVYLVANKIDGLNAQGATSDFYSLGLGTVFGISAEHGEGVKELLAEVVSNFAKEIYIGENEAAEKEKNAVKIAFVGRPNVGKSTLVNRIFGEERVVTSNVPGTTRDSIFIDFNRRGKNYILIDTAGIRRRKRISETSEKFSVVKALQSIELANIVVMLFDATETITEQDLRLLGFVLECGKGIVIAVNKWDDLSKEQRAKIKKELDRRLDFIDFADVHFISALHGTGVGDLFSSIDKAFLSATKKIKTAEITDILLQAVNEFPPPLVNGRRIKLRYAHIGGHNPPIIVIHGNQTKKVPQNYAKYLERYFRKKLRLSGTVIKIEFKTTQNPYNPE